MFRRLILMLAATIFLSGCMPTPINESKESKIEQNMIIRSLISAGNTCRINQKIKTAKKGEKTVFAYIGTSVFADEENNTAKESFELIKNYLGKKANAEYINYSIKAGDSFLADLILVDKVIEKKPDIIFLDLAVYDSSGPDCRKAFETIVRKCLLAENQPQVVIFLNSNSNGQPKQDFMEQIAKYYNLPFINVATAVQPEFSSGRMQKNDFYKEENEVTENGKHTLAKFLENYVLQSLKEKRDKDYTVPVPMYQNENPQVVKYVDVSEIKPENVGSYSLEKNDKKYFDNKLVYIKDSDNSPFLFTVEADKIWLIIPVSTDREAVAEIYINGKKHTEISTNDASKVDIPKVFKVYSSEKTENISVGIKMKEETNENNEEISEQSKNKIVINNKTEETPQEEQKEQTEQTEQKPQKEFELWGAAYTTK